MGIGNLNLLEMSHISKMFPGVKALDDVSFSLKPGEIHALIGENGTGKSTLMKILFGMYRQDEGDIILKGKKIVLRKPEDALKKGICMIHQEISLVPTMTIAENIWLGREKRHCRHGILQPALRDNETKKLLEDIGVPLNPTDTVSELSVANMQLVEIARAVSYNAEIIIMDEPTSALTNHEVDVLFHLMKKLTREDKAIVFISHKLEEIRKVCDRITVMRDGRYIATIDNEGFDHNELIRLIVGRELKDMYPKVESEVGETALSIENLCNAKSGLENIGFHVKAGEILGFCGLMGAGRTELMRTVFGIEKADRKDICLFGRHIEINNPRQAIKHGLAMVTEDRLRLGIIPMLSLKFNMSLVSLTKSLRKWIFVKLKKEKEMVNGYIKKLNIKSNSQEQLISTLSGGNQQKAIIGRWLLSKPKVLILDEPTRGIDIGSKAEIHRQISMLASQGIAVIMVSSDLPEILGMCDRILVMREGRIEGEFMKDEVDQEKLMSVAFGTRNIM